MKAKFKVIEPDEMKVSITGLRDRRRVSGAEGAGLRSLAGMAIAEV